MLALVVITAMALGSPYALAWLRLIAPVQQYAWLVMLVATAGMALKILFGDYVSGGFRYYKHGYDMCIMTFGALLSHLSVQLLSNKDLFPGMLEGGMLAPLLQGQDPVAQKRVVLLVLFVLSLVGTAVTARIARAVDTEETKAKGLLSLLNFVIGAAFLGVFVLMLVSKGS